MSAQVRPPSLARHRWRPADGRRSALCVRATTTARFEGGDVHTVCSRPDTLSYFLLTQCHDEMCAFGSRKHRSRTMRTSSTAPTTWIRASVGCFAPSPCSAGSASAQASANSTAPVPCSPSFIVFCPDKRTTNSSWLRNKLTRTASFRPKLSAPAPRRMIQAAAQRCRRTLMHKTNTP